MASVLDKARRREFKKGPPPLATEFPVRRYSLDEYHYLIEIGVLGTHDRVELLKGWIVPKMSIYPPHASSVSKLNALLGRRLSDAFSLRIQCPVTLRRVISEPEPDVVIARGPLDLFSDRHPHADEVALLIEVADSSIKKDRGIKIEVYALSKIEQYWIVNLNDSTVEVYTKPIGGKKAKYEDCVVYEPGESIPLVIDGKTLAKLAVNDILP